MLDVSDKFRSSNTWLEGFKKRYDLVFRSISGENKEIDGAMEGPLICTEKLLPWWHF